MPSVSILASSSIESSFIRHRNYFRCLMKLTSFLGAESLRIPSKLRNVKIVVIFKVRSVLVRTLLLNNEMPQPYWAKSVII